MTAFSRAPIEIIPEWLAATRDVEIATGLSREEALLRARKLRHLIREGKVSPKDVELDEEGKDVLHALFKLLDEETLDPEMLQTCDRIYRFLSKITWPHDDFGERDEILLALSKLGWRSAPGGIGAVLQSRVRVWDRWDSRRYHSLCNGAESLRERVEGLKSGDSFSVDRLTAICSDLFTLASLRPAVVEISAESLWQVLSTSQEPIGYLDDRNHLIGVTALSAGIASRVRSNWRSAAEWYRRAEIALRNTIEPSDVDRVDVERLAYLYTRGKPDEVAQGAPCLIHRVKCPLERAKAQLILASAQLSLGRPAEARVVIETALGDDALREAPTLRAWLVTKRGNALSALELYDEADATFQEALRHLSHLEHPLLFPTIFSDIGEHFTKRGRLSEALGLYRAARQAYQSVGSSNFVAYLSILVAELLCVLGRTSEAEIELLHSLPLIEEFQLEREGIAAVALLRELVAKSRTDLRAIQAVREHLRTGLY